MGLASFSLGENCAIGCLQEKAGVRVGNLENMTIVPTITIDSIIEHTGLIPDVIKIDVEGAELQVLQGGKHTLTRIRPDIFLSTHSTDMRSLCLQHLDSMNYNIIALNDHGLEASEYYAIGN